MNSTGLRQHADRAVILAAIFLVVLAVLPYLQTFSYGFVDFDDQLYVSGNPHIEHGLTWSSICWAFTTFRTGNWHPLTWLSHMLDIDLWGSKAGGHHFTSVLVHAGNTFLLFFVLRQMTGGLWRCALVSALFAVHPLHVESVAWVSERKDVLSAFFGLLALWAYLGYARSSSRRKYLLMIVFFVLSLLAKPMLVTFPFLLLFLDLWPLRRWQLWPMESQMVSSSEPRPLRRLLLEKVPLFVLAAVFSSVAIISQRTGQSVVSLDDFSVAGRLANAVVGYVLYLSKLLAPLKLTFFYPRPDYWPPSDIVLSALFLLIVSVAAFVYRREYPWLLVGWLWFLCLLVPVIGLVQIGWQAIADRYTYLPSVGIFIMIVWSIPAVIPSRFPQVSMAAAVVLLALFTAKSWRQVSYWKDSRALFTHAAQVTRGNFFAHQYLGTKLEKEEDYMGALELYRVAAAERPRYAKTKIHENIANILIRQGRYTEAKSELKTAMEIDPKSAVAYNSMGTVMNASGENEKAVTYFRSAVEFDPKNTAARVNYGMALVRLGRWDEAIAQLSPVVRAEPQRLVARTNLALAFANRGNFDQAVGELRQVLQIDSQFAPAQEALQKIEEAHATSQPSPAMGK
jgi:protein O-mannosyl-transferase